MSNNPYSDNRFTRFLTGKGFYVVLALCLAGAGGAAWLATAGPSADPHPSPEAEQRDIAQQLSSAQWGFPILEEAGQSQPDVPVEPSSSSSESLSVPPQSDSLAAGSPRSDVPASSQSQPFVLPIEGEIFADYSNGELVKNETLGDWRTHNGIDVKAAEGTEVRSAASGTVRDVRSDPLWGYVVEIEHPNGMVSIYCGLDKDIPVRKGDSVSAAQAVGKVGYIPAESLLPAHLHFEIKQDGKWLDPLAAMDKR